MRRPGAILVLSLLLAACGGGDDDGGGAADGPGGGADASGSGADALPPSTPFEDLSDAQHLALCAEFRDAACATLSGGGPCPPSCDPCAVPDYLTILRDTCADNTTVGDVATCIATLHDPPKGETDFCDGQAACLVEVINLACER